MPTPISSDTYAQLMDWAAKFSQYNDAQPVDGEYYDMPGVTVYTQAKRKLKTGGRLEANLTTPDAGPDFAWRAELTIDDLANDKYQHVLLQGDGTVVETYGKNVIEVDEDGAQAILKNLQRLSA